MYSINVHCKVAVLCPVHLVWSSGWDVAKSTDTEHTHSELCINHSAEQVIDKQLNQRHITGAALFNQLSTDGNNLSAKSKHMLFKVQIAWKLYEVYQTLLKLPRIYSLWQVTHNSCIVLLKCCLTYKSWQLHTHISWPSLHNQSLDWYWRK